MHDFLPEMQKNHAFFVLGVQYFSFLITAIFTWKGCYHQSGRFYFQALGIIFATS